jgi:bifunctional non-homologous end joining protein LigD
MNEDLRTGAPSTVLHVDGRDVPVSSLDRILFPLVGFTKTDLIGYYTAVSPALLPHLRGRPLTLHRYPEGPNGPNFYQTRCPPHPAWLRTATVSFPRTGKELAVAVIDDLPGLIWAANLAAVELHPFLGRMPDLQRPVELVFDLDPGAPAGLNQACTVALAVRDFLSASGLRSWPTLSGLKGLHVHVPLNVPVTYVETKSFARMTARSLMVRMPDLVVDQMSRQHRTGKVFVDWSQNDPGKSTVVPYSLRGGAVPTVAAPVSWPEVEAASAGGVAGAIRPNEVLARIATQGDLIRDAVGLQQRLAAA